jgi:uncharacterized protein
MSQSCNYQHNQVTSVQASKLTLFVAPVLMWLGGCGQPTDPRADETTRIEQWRVKRIANLTSETGWLTLAGLYWLQEGDNSFGRAASNRLVLDHAALQDTAGVFELHDGRVSFTASNGSGITRDGQPVTHIELQPDTAEQPTELAVGSLHFYAIERAGKFGVRVRDADHPARKLFNGIDSFPVSTAWRVNARFEPYVPNKRIPIVNIVGMTEDMDSPGALVFDKDGRTWRLDAILESPTDTDLFVMFADATSGRESYGAGRYLYLPKPADNHVWLDFNQAYNPPCAFTEFATCPLPPRQNRLALAVTAGEKKYAAASHP